MVKIISEIGINHNGDIELAKKLIMLSKIAGSDYVKIQKRKDRKKKLIDMAVNDGWLLVFGNEVGHSAGYLSSSSNGNLAIQPIEL